MPLIPVLFQLVGVGDVVLPLDVDTSFDSSFSTSRGALKPSRPGNSSQKHRRSTFVSNGGEDWGEGADSRPYMNRVITVRSPILHRPTRRQPTPPPFRSTVQLDSRRCSDRLPWCTTAITVESSIGRDCHHPIISPSGFPSAAIVFRILHPILASTSCDASPLAHIAGPTIVCNGGMSSRPCSVCCSPIRCATCAFRAALALECCGCVPESSLTSMQAGRLSSERSVPWVSDRRGDSRLPHRRRGHRMQHRLALMQWDGRSGRSVNPPASNRGHARWSGRRR